MRAISRTLASICLVIGMLAGCQSTDSPRAAHQRSMTGFATLASSGTFEEAAAPLKTRAAKLAYNVDRLAASKRLPAGVADQVRARLSLAATLIEDAHAADRAGNDARKKDKLRWASAAIEDGEVTLAKGRS